MAVGAQLSVYFTVADAIILHYRSEAQAHEMLGAVINCLWIWHACSISTFEHGPTTTHVGNIQHRDGKASWLLQKKLLKSEQAAELKGDTSIF